MLYPERFHRRALPLAVCLALLPLAQAASSAEPGANELSLDTVVVSATRAKGVAGETPQKVTVISREQIEQQLAISDDSGAVLSNLIPSYSPSRQKLSNSGESFRGRSALYMIDGVPQSNPLRDGSRDSYTIDLSMVERIEVIHGASAEHGLGATGGIINFVTRSADSGSLSQHAGVSVSSDDDFKTDGQGHKLDYRISGQQGAWDFLGAASVQRRGMFYSGDDELIGNNYAGETQNSDSHDIMAKLGYWLDDNQNIELSINRFELEGRGGYVPVPGDRDTGVATTAESGDDGGDPEYNKVTTANLTYSHADWLGNAVDLQLYSQRFRSQFGTSPYFPYLDDSGSTSYDQTRNESDKLGAKFTIHRDGLLDDHLSLTAGVDILKDETRQMLVHTGRIYVPETEFDNRALFLQGDLNLTDSLMVQAGVRHERASLNVDTYTTVDRSGGNLSDGVVVDGGSPDFNETLYNGGVVYQVTPWANLYANYSEGFGMPDVGRVLRGISASGSDVDNLLQLEPIVTDNREVGARFDWGRYGLELSYYESDSDLGERLSLENGVWVGNREKTEIHGIEVTAHAQVNDAHRLTASYTQADGESDTDGDGKVDADLNGANIAPDTLKLAWNARWNERLSSHLRASHYFDRSIDDPDYEFDGYTLVDLGIGYRLPVGHARFGVENLFDRDYFTYYSQAARASDDYNFKGRGRMVKLSYNVDF